MVKIYNSKIIAAISFLFFLHLAGWVELVAAPNDNLFELKIKWKCINGEYHLFKFEEYEIGAFYHHSHQHSIRTQTWNKKKKYQKSVAIQVVPYIRKVKTGNRYNIVPLWEKGKKGKVFNEYRLACSDEDEKILDKYPHLYPMIHLTPDDKSEQQRLKEFLTDLEKYDLIDPLIKGLKFYYDRGYPGVKYKGKRIKSLGDLLDPVLLKKKLSFLDTWTGGPIDVAVSGSQRKKYWHKVIPQDREQYDEQRGVTFSITLPEEINEMYIINYGGEQVESRGGETFEITLEEGDLPQEVQFQFKEVYLRDCSFNHWLVHDQATDWRDQATDRKGVTLKPECKKNIIKWAPGYEMEFSEDSCVDDGELEKNKKYCIRRKDKDIKVSWTGGWKESIIKASELNSKKEVFIGPDVSFTVAIHKDAPFSYRYGNKEFGPGKKIVVSLPYNSLTDTIKFTNKQYPDCNFSENFTFQQVHNKKLITLKSPCKRNSIQLPEGAATNISQKGCLNKDSKVKRNTLKCIRLKTENLTIKGDRWEETIPKAVLNRNENSQYKLDPTFTTAFRWQKGLGVPEIEGCENEYKINKNSDNYFIMDCERKLNSSVAFKWNNGLEQVVPSGNTKRIIKEKPGKDVVELDPEADFFIHIAGKVPFDYNIGTDTIKAGEKKKISLPFSKWKDDFAVTKNPYQECTISHDLISYYIDTLVFIDPNCKAITITSPAITGKPKTEDCINLINGEVIKGERKSTCVYYKEKKYITLEWNNAIKTDIETNKLTHNLKAKDFYFDFPISGSFPFLKNSVNEKSDICKEEPGYAKKAFLYYYKGEPDKNRLGGKKVNLDSPPGRLTLEGWDIFGKGLPDHGYLEVESTSRNPGYKNPYRYDWSFTKEIEKKEISKKDVLQKLPVRIETAELPFSNNAKFYLYDNKDDCDILHKLEHKKYGTEYILYQQSNIEKIKSNICQYAVVVKNKKPISKCVPGKVENGKTMLFTMKSNLLSNKRIVIVIENSKLLGEKRRGRSIQNGLIDWLQDRNKVRDFPITLISVEDTGYIKKVITNEEIMRINKRGKNPQSLIKQLTEMIRINIDFSGSGHRPLENMKQIRTIMDKDNNISRVLYFTEGNIPDEISFGNEAGALRSWSDVTIVTEREETCDMWREQGEVTECKGLKENVTKSDIIRILDTFVGRRE